MKKSNKKIKIKKKDLDKFSPDRIMSDFDSVNSVLSKIDFLDENLTEEDALTLQTELQQIESYLNNQYKEYIDVYKPTKVYLIGGIPKKLPLIQSYLKHLYPKIIFDSNNTKYADTHLGLINYIKEYEHINNRG